MKTLLFLLLTSIPSFINAQNLIKSKTTDNWYVGVNMGWSAKYNGNCVGYYHNEEPGTTRNLDDYNIMKNLNMNMGLRIGSHLTPTFGLGLDISGSFGNKPDPSFDRAIKEIIIADDCVLYALGNSCFEGCEKLTTLTFPSSVQTSL